MNPAPPGQRGGAYRPLSDADMAAIYDTALRLLAELVHERGTPALVNIHDVALAQSLGGVSDENR